MADLSLSSPYFERIQGLFIDDEFTLQINNKKAKIPLINAVSSSELIHRMYISDNTSRFMRLRAQVANESNIEKLFSMLKGQTISINEADYEDFYRFSDTIGNNDLALPYCNFLSESLSVFNVLKALTFRYKKANIDEEIAFAAKNFSELYNDSNLLEWSISADFGLIEKIVNSPKLLLKNEDELLDYIISICHQRDDCYQLFSAVHLEYCSAEMCNLFCDFTMKLPFRKSTFQYIWQCAMRRIRKEVKLNNAYEPNRHEKINVVTPDNPLNGVFVQLRKEEAVKLSSSGVRCGSLEDLIVGLDNHNFVTNNEANSWVSADLINNTVIPTGYMIRGRFDEYHQMQSWTFEGKTIDGNWIVLDEHTNEPFHAKEIRTFDVNGNNTKMTAFRITQTSKNISGGDNLCILGFDVFGIIDEISAEN